MSSGNLAKPVLRGFVQSHLKRHLSIALALSFATAMAWKFFIADPRKERYAEFYRNYDADADYERMKALGVLPPFPECDDDEE